MQDTERGISIHESAIVHPAAILGQNSIVHAYAIVREGVMTGPYCAIGSKVYVGSYARLGEAVRIQDGAHITARTQIGDRVFIGALVSTADDRHPKVNNPFYRPEPPVIEDDVSIGNSAVILPGIRLGRGCVIGAGAVVTRSVPPYTTVIGNPARPLRPAPCDVTDGD